MIIKYLIVINIMTFIIFAYDKLMSKLKRRRISENTLLLLSTIGGIFGAIVSMIMFRHKIKKRSFLICIFASILLQICIGLFVISRIYA